MKTQYIFFLLIGTVLLTCNDFLDREPLDSASTDKYLKEESDLAAYSAKLYESLPSHKEYGMGIFKNDNNSDNQAASNPNDKFVKGQTRVEQTLKEGDDPWNFSTIRSVNYFINTVRPRLENGELGGTGENNEHYLGEMYFFRAWFYFLKLADLGDFPILKEWISEDYETVREASKRRPRNEVARFILQDLDSAYILMKTTSPMSNRLTRNCAALLKSRVALFEATWEKYHKNTARVPGGTGWPGAEKEYLKGFSIDIESEIRFFLTEAMNAASIVADSHSLHGNYEELFNSKSLTGINEALLWRQYDASLTPSVNHFVVGYIQRDGGGNTGFTRSMVQSFLMENGLPVYANGSGYQGDTSYETVAAGRDPRFHYNILLPGDLLSEKASFNEYVVNGEGYYYRAPITQPQNENKCPTGYSVKKD